MYCELLQEQSVERAAAVQPILLRKRRMCSLTAAASGNSTAAGCTQSGRVQFHKSALLAKQVCASVSASISDGESWSLDTRMDCTHYCAPSRPAFLTDRPHGCLRVWELLAGVREDLCARGSFQRDTEHFALHSQFVSETLRTEDHRDSNRCGLFWLCFV